MFFIVNWLIENAVFFWVFAAPALPDQKSSVFAEV
jgi:hypothetical protein